MRASAVVQRDVFDGKNVNATAVSASYDMALALLAGIAGNQRAMAVQPALAYDPQAPFNCSSPQSTSPALVARVRAHRAAPS
jgi:ABC-type uncharacterized transport system YnjBCD ATPase subunit